MWREMKAEWDDLHEAEFMAAEEATNGVMVSRYGHHVGVTSRAVFKHTYPKYASEELLAYLREHPRTTLAAFELQWMRGRVFA